MLCFTAEYTTTLRERDDAGWPLVVLLHYPPPAGSIVEMPVPSRHGGRVLKQFRVVDVVAQAYIVDDKRAEYAGRLTLAACP